MDQSRGLWPRVGTAYWLGMAKTAQLKAALEIGRRLSLSQVDEKYQIKSPADAANLVITNLQQSECRPSFSRTLRYS
jgi:DNA repair protein RadC